MSEGLFASIGRARVRTSCLLAVALFVFGAGASLAQDAVREKVSFAAATALDGGVTVNGELKIPAGSRGKAPAVVVIHGSGGLYDEVGTPYIEALNKAGIATLELDLFARGERPASTRANLPHTFGSLVYLAKDPRIDAARIGVMGFSWGGVLSLLSASEELTRAYTGGAYRFAAHLPVYPVCWAHTAILQGKNRIYSASIYEAMTGSPVHILVGAADDYEDDADSCPKFVRSLPASVRSHVNVTVYPDAGHGFDIPASRNREYSGDPTAHMGRGGDVRYFRNDAAADKAHAFAAEFFKSSLVAK